MKKRNLIPILVLTLVGLLLGSVPAVASPGAWWGDYFATLDLSGAPVLSRYDETINFSWGAGSPASGLPSDNFSVRWTQSLYFRAGTYRFTTYTDDGIRLWVDGHLLIDAWRPMRGYRSATVRLSEGTHDVRMKYFERTEVALARLTWRRLSDVY